ncbi:uncharacterized protein LOC104887094 isoform X2 [Beta vulgaris subsp. vulgaris]|uniref:uncharacterized protein LOC104887094 isoform X2 n=1 Tax=Beta vulgaris subsp. vulgaris TaxID=3555 RepID=UPI0020368571|nr:uncharacterized protein LOC104887094 isoform X2 [Beta vulgaris subsp. vulgaris]
MRESSSGYFPKYGAIFMANNSTRKECFERELFGLPYEFTDFVMEVKTGMLLFLFDYQEKNLYGVFEATSDGAMNIVPDAYTSTSKKFPAQVGRLLTLFGRRKLKVPSSPVSTRLSKRSNNTEKSVVATHPGSLENSISFAESMQVSVPEKVSNLDASDQGHAADLEDYIPLPSVEPEEIEDPPGAFLWGANFSALWSSAEQGGTDEKKLDTDTRYHAQGWDSDSLKPASFSSGSKRSIEQDDHKELDAFLWGANFSALLSSAEGGTDEKKIDTDTRYHVQGWDSDSLKPASCSSGPERSIAQDNHKKVDESSDLQVQGMYSDSSKNRTSVFLRLAGIEKVMVEDRHGHRKSKVDSPRDILKRLDERRKMWKCKRSTETPSRSGVSVFSRLRSNVGRALESQKVLAGGSEPTGAAEEFTRQDLKRKTSCSLNINANDCNDLPGKKGERRSRRKCSKSSSSITRTPTVLSNVLDLSDGSSVCTINSAYHKGF